MTCEKIPNAQREKFVHFFTYPNVINLLNHSINMSQRYHIPAKLPDPAISWDFAGKCVVADVNRCLNYLSMAVPVLRGCSMVSKSASAAARSHDWVKAANCAKGFATAAFKAAELLKTLKATELAIDATRIGKLATLNLSREDFQLAHSIDGIVEQLCYHGGVAALQPIRQWPSDEENLLNARTSQFLVEGLKQVLRNEFLFNQADQPGIHQLLGESMGPHAMWEARMQTLWKDRWLLERPPLVSA